MLLLQWGQPRRMVRRDTPLIRQSRFNAVKRPLENVAMTHTLALLGPLGGWEVALLLVLGLLIFGGRLPEVAKNMGKGIVEFKKGLKGIEEEVESAGDGKETPRIAKETTPNSVETDSKVHSEHPA